MKSTLLIHFCLCVLVSLLPIYISGQSVKYAPTGAIALDGNTLSNSIRKFEAIFLMIHVPWCNHCVRAMPEFEELAKTMGENGRSGKLLIATINGEENRDVAAKLNVKGYPTFVLLKGNMTPIPYADERKHIRFLNFLYTNIPNLKQRSSNVKNPHTSSNRRHYDL
ncbi:hypothetical protein MDAP_000114 [Mitosporidium daphniae]